VKNEGKINKYQKAKKREKKKKKATLIYSHFASLFTSSMVLS